MADWMYCWSCRATYSRSTFASAIAFTPRNHLSTVALHPLRCAGQYAKATMYRSIVSLLPAASAGVCPPDGGVDFRSFPNKPHQRFTRGATLPSRRFRQSLTVGGSFFRRKASRVRVIVLYKNIGIISHM